MKILNLYACLGGNRYKWDEVTDVQVTAVELDPELARLYSERFPNDTVIIGDAHQYLLDHYQEFDFVWSSPPCPTHSITNHFLNAKGVVRYPDMKLYQEIIFLNTFFKGKYLVENVVPYYTPLIPAKKRGRHLYWCNFNLPSKLSDRVPPKMNMNKYKYKKKVKQSFLKFHGIEELVTTYQGKQSIEKIANNLVDYVAGKTILDVVCGIYESNQREQLSIF